MTLTLAQICDLDCVASASPLCFDLPTTERYVYGAQAVAQRVLVGWATDAAILELEGRSWSAGDIARYQALLASIAEDEDFVLSASVTVAVVDGGAVTVTALLILDDGSPTGIQYPLELSAADGAVAMVFPQ
jgi:hypothetical protein